MDIRGRMRRSVRVHMHRWVVWWFYVGVACGAVAVVNILGRDLSRSQERLILLAGVAHWVLGGVVCYACDAIRIEESPDEPKPEEPAKEHELPEWHPASDFLLPGGRKTLLPPRL